MIPDGFGVNIAAAFAVVRVVRVSAAGVGVVALQVAGVVCWS